MAKFFDAIFNLNIYLGIALSFIVFLSVGFLLKGIGYSDQFSVLISVSSFLFGIFVAFASANCHARFTKVNETLKSDEALMWYLYKSSSVFGDEVQNEVRRLIDNYLIAQIDYYLEDFKCSNDTFVQLFDYMTKLEPNDTRQELTYSSMLNALTSSSANRKLVETLVQERMLKFEWASVLILLLLIYFLIFSLNDGSVASVFVTALLSASATILVFVLRDLDSLRWKESDWIWEPLESLFTSLGLVPYYPASIIKEKRAKLTKGQEYRIVEYPDPYPIMSTKNIRTITA